MPHRLVYRLRDQGHDAFHPLDLDAGSRTPDHLVSATPDRDGSAFVTKDADFVNAHVLAASGRQLKPMPGLPITKQPSFELDR